MFAATSLKSMCGMHPICEHFWWTIFCSNPPVNILFFIFMGLRSYLLNSNCYYSKKKNINEKIWLLSGYQSTGPLLPQTRCHRIMADNLPKCGLNILTCSRIPWYPKLLWDGSNRQASQTEHCPKIMYKFLGKISKVWFSLIAQFFLYALS